MRLRLLSSWSPNSATGEPMTELLVAAGNHDRPAAIFLACGIAVWLMLAATIRHHNRHWRRGK